MPVDFPEEIINNLPELLLGTGDVRTTPRRVVFGHGLVYDLRAAASQLLDALGKVQHGVLRDPANACVLDMNV